MNLRTILQSGNVVRFHNSIGMDKQKNSEHQWETTLILQYIYPECSKELLVASLTHDSAEYYTGDIPFPVKQASPEIKKILDNLEHQWEVNNGVSFNLTEEERYFLKVADTLSGLWFCILQMKEGKISARRPFRKWKDFLTQYMSKGDQPKLQKAYYFFKQLCLEMEQFS